MTLHSFTVSDAINTGWKFTKKYFWTIMLLGAIVYLPSLVSNLFSMGLPYIPQDIIDPESTWVSILVFILVIIGARLGLWLIKTNLMIVEDKKPILKDLFVPFIYLLRLIWWWFIAWLAIIISFIALIIPGIYVAIRLSMFKYFIAEWYWAIDSIKASWDITQWWKIFDMIWVSFVYFIIIWLSIIPLVIGILLWLLVLWLLWINFWIGFIEITIVWSFWLIWSIGLLWALPTIMLAQTYVYTQLKKNLPHDFKPIN